MGRRRRRGVGRGSRAGRRANYYDGLPARGAPDEDVPGLDQGGGGAMHGRSSGRRRGSASSGRSSAAGRRSRGGGDEFDADEGVGRSSRSGASAGRGMDKNMLYALIGLGAVVLLVLVVVLASRGGGNKPSAASKKKGSSITHRKTSGSSTASRTTNPQPAPAPAGPPMSKDTFISPDVSRGLGGGQDPSYRGPPSADEINDLTRDPYSGGGE